jgi:plasmid stabilization system protein ParE
MAEYRLSVRARSHLLDIYEFTTLTFGQYQAKAYHAGPESTFSLLADFRRIGQPMDELASRHRRFRFQSPQHLLDGRRRAPPDPCDLSLRAGHQAAAVRLAHDAVSEEHPP